MQVDKLFGTSKIVGKILNQYQIDYVMNLKNTVKYYVMSSPHVISCVGIKIWHRTWFEVMYDLLGFFLIIMFWSPNTKNGKSKDSSYPSLMYICIRGSRFFLGGRRDNFVGQGGGGWGPKPILIIQL